MLPSVVGYTIIRSATYFAGPTTVLAPSKITVLQQEYNHEVLALVNYNQTNLPNRYLTGVPVTVTWGLLNKRVQTFYGYVHHVEPIVTPSFSPALRNLVKVVCIGTTYPMQSSNRRVFTQRTIPSVIQEILRGYKFSSEIGSSDQVWDTLVQDNISDWQFICSLAQRLGWTVNVKGTDVIIGSRYIRNVVAQNTAARFMAPGAATSAADAGVGNISTFQEIDGETTPDGGQKANRAMQGIDPWQGTSFNATMGVLPANLGAIQPPPVFNAYEPGVARTYNEAGTRLAGKAANNKMYLQATAEVVGDATVRPGQVVFLGGLGTKSNGYWYVQSAEHELDQGAYTLYLKLGRDASWDMGARPNFKRRKIITPRVNPSGDVVAQVPDTVLVNGIWQAAYSAPVS